MENITALLEKGPVIGDGGYLIELERRGYGGERVWIRMSGCPNACSRPPTAEIGIVGRSLGLYNVYVGGSFQGTRLARLYREEVRANVLADVLAEALDQWRRERAPGEAFGDWAARELVGQEAGDLIAQEA